MDGEWEAPLISKCIIFSCSFGYKMDTLIVIFCFPN